VVGTDEQKQRAFDTTARQLLSRIRRWLSLTSTSKRIQPDV
jgi:hypothetical protein